MKAEAVEAARILEQLLSDHADDLMILRNPEIAATLSRGGDVDLLVRAVGRAEALITAALGLPILRLRRSYVLTLVYPWGHLDLTDGISWKWIPYLSAGAAFAEKRMVSGIALPSRRHEAIICWFSSLFWGGFTKDRYKDLIQEAAQDQNGALPGALAEFLAPELAAVFAELAKDGRWNEAPAAARKAKLHLLEKNGIVKNILGALRYLAAECRLRLHPRTPVIAVLGPDGAGKSTILAGIEERVKGVFGGVTAFHWRPGVLPDIGVATRQRTKTGGPTTDPHARPAHPWPIGLARLFYYSADYVLGWYSRVADARARNRLVVFDRYAYDMIVDPRRFRFKLPRPALALAVWLAPRPDLVFCLDAPAGVLQERKTEVSFAETERQRAAYCQFTAALPQGHIIDANRPVPEICDDMLARLFARMRSANAQSRLTKP